MLIIELDTDKKIIKYHIRNKKIYVDSEISNYIKKEFSLDENSYEDVIRTFLKSNFSNFDFNSYSISDFSENED